MSKKRKSSARAPVSQPAQTVRAGWWPELGIYVLLALITAAAYAQVRHFDFVNLDDPDYVSQNRQSHPGLRADGLVWAFTSIEDANWFPVTRISLLLDRQIFGLHAGGYHVTNVLLHILSTLLLFTFLKRATGARWPAALVAFLFALHPLHVESVAWIAERKDVLSVSFWFATLCAYLRYVERASPARYGLVLMMFSLGLMSKSMLVTLPFVLLLLDVWPLRRIQSLDTSRRFISLIREKVPLFALSIIVSVLTFLAQRQAGGVAPLLRYPFGWRVQNALASYVVYIAKMVWPSGLAVAYPYTLVPAWLVLLAAATLGVASLFAIRAWRRYPYVAVGWFWYLGTLLPVIGLVQVGTQSRADRYTYLPMVGLSIVLAWGGADLLRRWPRAKPAVAGLAAVAGGALIVVTWFQIGFWANSESLFQHALTVTQNNVTAHINLAAVYLDQKRYGEALTHSQEAVRLEPNSPEAQMNLAAALGNVGQLADSEAHFRTALRLQPASAKGHSWLGVSLIQQGRTAEALQEQWNAVRIDPDYAGGHDNLGRALATSNRFNEAISQFSEAVRLEPENPEFHYDFGTALASLQQYDDAIREFTEAVRLTPGNLRAHFNLGSALAIQGNLDDAIAQFTMVLRSDPDFPGARESLNTALAIKNGAGR